MGECCDCINRVPLRVPVSLGVSTVDAAAGAVDSPASSVERALRAAQSVAVNQADGLFVASFRLSRPHVRVALVQQTSLYAGTGKGQ